MPMTPVAGAIESSTPESKSIFDLQQTHKTDFVLPGTAGSGQKSSTAMTSAEEHGEVVDLDLYRTAMTQGGRDTSGGPKSHSTHKEWTC